MRSINELEKEQRDALIFWIYDLCDKDPIMISDPHNYLSIMGLACEISQEAPYSGKE